MKKVSTYLNIAGIASIIGSIVLIEFPVIMAIFIVLGLYFIILANKDLNTMYRHRIPLLILGILFCFINLITGILSILAYDKLESMKKNGIKAPPKEKIDKESRKIDLLLKLGVAMVFIAGILFATTSWEVITNLIKLIILVVLGLFFLGLSLFSEKKLKIETTTRMYWLLSMSFFFLAVFGMFYYGAINSYLSFDGDGSCIAIGITSLFTALLSLATAFKFKNNFFKYLGYLAIFIGIDSFTELLPESIIDFTIYAYLLFFTIMILVFNKEKSIHKFSKVFLYVFAFLPLGYILEVGNIHSFIIMLLTIIYLFIISKKGNIVDKILPFILMFYQIVSVIYTFDIPYRELIVISFTSLIAIVNRLKLLDNSKASSYTTSIMNPILAIVLFVIAIMNSSLEGLLFSIIYLVYTIISGIDYFKDSTYKIDYFLQPIAISYLVISGLNYIDSKVLEVTIFQVLSILSLVFALAHFIVRKNSHKIEYLVFTMTTLIISLLFNSIEPDLVAILILLIPSAYLVLYYNNKNSIIRNISYVLLLLVTTVLFLVNNLISNSSIINSFVLLWLFAMLLILLFKDKQLRIINYFAIIIPMCSLLLALESNYIYYKIIVSLIEFYVLFLLVHHVLPNKLVKHIGAAIGTSLIVIQLLFITDLLLGIYIGILGIIFIGISFLYKDYNSLFWIGLVTTIVNIIYQLKDLWGQLPFWLYLLICGLGIIIFVTYKELKRSK